MRLFQGHQALFAKKLFLAFTWQQGWSLAAVVHVIMAEDTRFLHFANDLLHAASHLALVVLVRIDELNDALEQNVPEESIFLRFDFDVVANMSAKLFDNAIVGDRDAQLLARVVDALREIALALDSSIHVLDERKRLLCPVLLPEGRQEPSRFAWLRLYRVPECKVLLLRVGTVQLDGAEPGRLGLL